MSYTPGTIDQYEKLFGIIAIEKGFISRNDLINALTIQVKEHAKNNNQRFIRNILLDHNIIPANQIEEVVKAIFQQSADRSV